jgi:Ca2+-binding EF-hand superfamily protein
MSINALSSTDPAISWEALFGVSNSKKTQQADDLATTLFSDLDTDGNGELSLEESGLAQKTYDALDTDHDGVVSPAELGQALELQRSAMFTLMKLEPGESGGSGGSGAGGSQPAFDALDTNQDGIVSAAELAAALQTQSETMGTDTGSTRTGVAQRAKDLLVSLANRAYGAMNRTVTDSQNINFKA